MSDYIHVFMTASTIGPNGQEDSGWIDPSWSMTVLHQYRNDAGTVLSLPEDDEDLLDQLKELIEGYHDCGDGTFLAVDAVFDMTTGISWAYALHMKRKAYGPNGYYEQPYIPVFPSVLTESTEDVKVFQEL